MTPKIERYFVEHRPPTPCLGVDLDVGKFSGLAETMGEAIRYPIRIPGDLWACHTAVIGGYAVEGHVPVEAIDRLLAEKPQIKGIALPGMPSGSPGMPGPKTEKFIIYTISDTKPAVF